MKDMELGTRSRQWLVVALVAATIISGIALLLRSSYLAEASRLDLVQTSAADLYRLSALEWEAIASEQVEAETRATLEGLTTGLVTSGESLAEQGVLPGDALGQLAVLIDGLNRELDLLEAGRLDAALEVDEEVVDPTFDGLMIVYQQLAVEARAKAERTNLVTGLLFVILILAGVVLSSFGVRKSESLLRLEQLVQIKDRFTASVSHELRTPLTVALGIAEILEEGSHDMGEQEQRELLGVLVQQTRDMNDIIDDLLVAARSEIGTIAVVIEPVEVVHLVRSVVVGLGAPQPVDVDVPDSLTALADPGRLRQVARNLLVNAVRYGGDRITVRGWVGADRVYLDVSDNGAGIPELDRERMFEAFTRAKTGQVSDSVGIGLYISRHMTELMGGHLTYHHGPTGPTFRVELPLAHQDTTASEPNDKPTATDPAGEMGGLHPGQIGTGTAAPMPAATWGLEQGL